MVNQQQAKTIAQNAIFVNSEVRDLTIIDEETIEEPFGWIFFYNSKRYLETRNIQYRVLGNAPIIVDRCDGSVHFTGTSESIETYIEEYRRKRTQNC